MFWKRDKADEAPPPLTSNRPQVESGDEALETVAAMLRSLGQHAFDLDDKPKAAIEEEFERLARRLLLGEARGEAETSPESVGRPSGRKLLRDYGGVRRSVEQHRAEEGAYVESALHNLRTALQVFVHQTTGILRMERSHAGQLDQELDRLDLALARNDHEEIRRHAELMALTTRKQLDEKRRVEKETLDSLRGSLAALKSELEQARRSAAIDALTQVYNRAALDLHLSQVADAAFLSSETVCLVMVDVDHFKRINDNYGHPTGDEVLRKVADTLVRGFFRREDFVARYGGEEFCIVARLTSFEMTRERAERLRKAVEDLRIDAFGQKIRVSVSFGIAQLEPGESPKSWVTRADAALYRAKEKGRNRISIAPPGCLELPGSGEYERVEVTLNGEPLAQRAPLSCPPSSAAASSNAR